MARLNIFVDETGEFGFDKGSAKLYGVSLVFHEHKNNIQHEIKILEERLDRLDFYSMVHMGDLVTGHGDFKGMTIAERRKIYAIFYKFSRQITATYHTIIIDKKDAHNSRLLSNAIHKELSALILDNLSYLQQFDQIKIYYDGGQKPLNKIIKDTFSIFCSYEQKSDFDHTEKKLFQVADMLTYVDKLIYKYQKHIKFANTEQTFFDDKHIKNIIRMLKSHRF